MPSPGQPVPASERAWWWKVAKHIDDAQLAAANALALNVDDPSRIHMLQETLRQGQAILLQIFQAKGVLPAAPAAPAARPANAPQPPVGLPVGGPLPPPPAGPPPATDSPVAPIEVLTNTAAQPFTFAFPSAPPPSWLHGQQPPPWMQEQQPPPPPPWIPAPAAEAQSAPAAEAQSVPAAEAQPEPPQAQVEPLTRVEWENDRHEQSATPEVAVASSEVLPEPAQILPEEPASVAPEAEA